MHRVNGEATPFPPLVKINLAILSLSLSTIEIIIIALKGIVYIILDIPVHLFIFIFNMFMSLRDLRLFVLPLLAFVFVTLKET